MNLSTRQVVLIFQLVAVKLDHILIENSIFAHQNNMIIINPINKFQVMEM